ncbi:hypothetical protein ACQP3J_30705, partial [Escherichia coli]
ARDAAYLENGSKLSRGSKMPKGCRKGAGDVRTAEGNKQMQVMGPVQRGLPLLSALPNHEEPDL